MSFEMQGFDKRQRQLGNAREALKTLDGEIATVQFSPEDQASVEAAIADMKLAIDSSVAGYAGNPFVAQIAEQMKVKYENHILEQVMDLKEKERCSPKRAVKACFVRLRTQ